MSLYPYSVLNKNKKRNFKFHSDYFFFLISIYARFENNISFSIYLFKDKNHFYAQTYTINPSPSNKIKLN